MDAQSVTVEALGCYCRGIVDVTCFRIFVLGEGWAQTPTTKCVGRGLGPNSDTEFHFVLGVGWAHIPRAA